MTSTVALRVTATGGREATTRHIPPKLALAVGMPSTPAPEGWRWSPLTKLARLESGHTPSRRHPEYWGGTIPWIGIQDARANDGRRIEDTEEKTNDLGIENSSARVLPENTVCLSRTASVGYVVVMGRPMATSQDFVNWVCAEQLDHDFLKYLFIAEGDDLLRFASGAVHQTIYFPEVKAFHVCHPPLPEQKRIVGILDETFGGIATSKANAEKNLQNAHALFESHLDRTLTHHREGSTRTELGRICERVTVGHVGITSPHYREDGVLFLRTQNVTREGLQLDNVNFITRQFHASLKKSQVEPGDILMSRVITDAVHCALIPPGFGPANCANVVVVRPGSKVVPEYLVWHIRSREAQRHLLSRKVGSAQVVVNTTVVKEWPLDVPPLPVQREIAANLHRINAETKHLESIYSRKLAALEALKKTLLHQAFAGQL